VELLEDFGLAIVTLFVVIVISIVPVLGFFPPFGYREDRELGRLGAWPGGEESAQRSDMVLGPIDQQSRDGARCQGTRIALGRV
jgi:hypothetical protein